VARYVASFLGRYPDPESLTLASPMELEQALAGLGLQRRRAASLRALAEVMLAKPDGPWASRPGVGQYISRAIAVGVDNESVAMVDSNFVRILRRVFHGPWMSDYRYDDRLQALASAAIAGAQDARSVNWATLDLGATVCKPRRPLCAECPLQFACETGSAHTF
jgi:A/G-specific adenine glycosylase